MKLENYSTDLLIDYIRNPHSISAKELISSLTIGEQRALKAKALADFEAIAMSDEAFAFKHAYHLVDQDISIYQNYTLEQLLETLKNYFQKNESN